MAAKNVVLPPDVEEFLCELYVKAAFRAIANGTYIPDDEDEADTQDEQQAI